MLKDVLTQNVLECAALRWVHAQYCWIVISFHFTTNIRTGTALLDRYFISLKTFEQERLYRAGASSSPVGIAPCLNAYWTLIVCPPLVGVVASYAAGIHLHRQCLHRLRVGYSYTEGDLRLETAAWIWRYVAWALGAGLGSGLLGIGGGMILGPLLLELGVNPRVSAPVTHYMVLFTSSMTVIQFAILGQLLLWHTSWFAGLCLAASVTSAVGLVAVLKKWGLGGSVIVLCLGAVIGLSAVLVLVELVTSGVSGGLNDGFSVGVRQLCGG
mmetsp:Transcript_46755/g.74810  ORF Transcript_46755/g.74810 Transcript_46755/m.74810 type:complete len:270 (-) Transcript_46755:643-1452(-)